MIWSRFSKKSVIEENLGVTILELFKKFHSW